MIQNNFQAESKQSGDEFEDIVEERLALQGSVLHKNFTIPECGVEVDFVAINMTTEFPRLELVEAKGGNHGDKKRPGAERTDNVKKAVANGAIIKAINPNLYYCVYFSAPPKPGSYADLMIKVALEAKYIDEVIYIS